MSETELEEVIEGCKLNIQKYQTKLYESYHPYAKAIVSKYYNDTHTVNDIVQEGFIKIFESIYKFSNEGSFKGWFSRVFRNFTIDKIRSKKYNVEYCDKYGDDIHYEDDMSKVVMEEKLSDVHSELDKLSSMYGLVFRMYYVEDMQHKEIAEELSIDIGTSKSNLHRAKKNIQNRLKNKKYE